MVQTIKILDINEALATLDDDQLIDYILEMQSGEGVEDAGENRTLITKKRLAQWKTVMGLISQLKEEQLLTTNEKNHLRAWLIKDEFDSALDFLEQKERGIMTASSKEVMFSLKEGISELSGGE